jgi:hypothetical protein
MQYGLAIETLYSAGHLRATTTFWMLCASYPDGDFDAAGSAKRKQLLQPDKGTAGSGDLGTEEHIGRSFSAEAHESKIRGISQWAWHPCLRVQRMR